MRDLRYRRHHHMYVYEYFIDYDYLVKSADVGGTDLFLS